MSEAQPAPRIERSQRWVRVMFGGEFVADSRRPLLLWEPPRTVPLYYFPKQDVRVDLLQPSDHTRPSPSLGTASYWSLRVGDRVAANACWGYQEPPAGAPDVSEYLTLKWDMMDAWFEEDEEVFVHPRDPHTRIDVLNSSRHVRVEIDGVTVADTNRPRLLFETGLPVRYYIPKLDVRMDLLTDSATVTRCPYKGQAAQYNLNAGGHEAPDVAWIYRSPLPESAGIQNLVAFYGERVDAIYVDDELQPRPQTA